MQVPAGKPWGGKGWLPLSLKSQLRPLSWVLRLGQPGCSCYAGHARVLDNGLDSAWFLVLLLLCLWLLRIPLMQLVVLLVKADTIDVNVAGSLRFTQQDWAAAADVFRRELAGVQLVDDRQVRLG